jgi:hypothetical protein
MTPITHGGAGYHFALQTLYCVAQILQPFFLDPAALEKQVSKT